MKAVFQLPPSHQQVLLTLLERVPPDEVLWVLTGSGGLRLQGVDTPVRDLDVQSDAEGVAEIALRLAEFTSQPLDWKESLMMRSFFGLLEIGGIPVELMGDIQHRLPDGNWSPPVDLPRHRRWVDWQGRLVPVLDLAYEAEAYARIGRLEKAELIRATLSEREDGSGG